MVRTFTALKRLLHSSTSARTPLAMSLSLLTLRVKYMCMPWYSRTHARKRALTVVVETRTFHRLRWTIHGGSGDVLGVALLSNQALVEYLALPQLHIHHLVHVSAVAMTPCWRIHAMAMRQRSVEPPEKSSSSWAKLINHQKETKE